MIDFRYEIIRALGSGGSGTVLLVQDQVRNAPVALKILHTENPSAEEREAIRQEFAVLAGFNHPNLIRVHDFGSVTHSGDESYAGKLFYSMDVLSGTTADNFFAAIPSVEDRIPLLESLAIQTLSVLNFIHSQGLIHFDIKPANLFIETNADGTLNIKLMDFGFCERSSGASEYPMRGTLDYTAPEILQGKPFDQRIDLYSLGVTLYELLTGCRPYQAANPVDLVREIIGGTYQPVALPAGRPTFLGQLVDHLCVREQDDRFATSRNALMEIAASGHATEVRHLMFGESPWPRIARDEDADLTAAIQKLLSPPQAHGSEHIQISGTVGAGKSSSLKAIALALRLQGTPVWELQQDREQPPAGAIESMMRYLNSERTAHGLQRIEFAARSIDSTSQLMAREIWDLTAGLNVVITIDDVESIHPFIVNVLNALCESENGCLLVTSSQSQSPVLAGRWQIHTMKEFSIQQIRDYCSFLIGKDWGKDSGKDSGMDSGTDSVESPFSAWFHRSFGGNPARLCAGALALAQNVPGENLNGALQSDTQEMRDLVTTSVGRMLLDAYEGISPALKSILSEISFLKLPHPEFVLESVLDIESGRLQSMLRSLEGLGFLRESGGRLAFASEWLHDVLYGQFAADRGQVHSQYAGRLERAEVTRNVDVREEIAHQHQCAGEHEPAAISYGIASDIALEAGDTPASIRLLRLAIIEAGTSRRRIPLLLRLGNLLGRERLYSECIVVTLQLQSLLGTDDKRHGFVAKSLGKAYSQLGDYVSALAQFNRALASTHSAREQFEIRQEIAAIHVAEGRYEEAIATGIEQKNIAIQLGDPGAAALVDNDLGIAYFSTGRLTDALASFEAASSAYASLLNNAKLIDARINVGIIHAEMRNYREALTCWGEALGMMDKNGSDHQRAQVLNNIGIARFHLGELDQAAECYREAREIFTRLDARSGVAFTLTNLGEVRYALGNYGEALDCWGQALDLYRKMNDPSGVLQSLLQQVDLYVGLTMVREASPLLEQSIPMLEAGDLSTYKGYLGYIKGRLHFLQGENDLATAAFNAALGEYSVPGAYAGGGESATTMEIRLGLGLARVRLNTDGPAAAGPMLKELAGRIDETQYPLLAAEITYYLGCAYTAAEGIGSSAAIVQYRKGFELAAQGAVSELAWQLALALGREFDRRGNTPRAIEHFHQVSMIMEYLTSQIPDENLRRVYRESPVRAAAIDEVALYLSSRKRKTG